MKKTYTETWTMNNEKLEDATVKILVYNANKYTGNITEEREIVYKGVTAWDIIEGGIEAEEIESMTDADGVDEHHEYLVLHLRDGRTATFKNSYVDMFIR